MTKKNPEKKKIHAAVICTGLICITALEAYALSQGINGVALTAVIGIIAGVVGYTIPSPIKQ